MNSWFWILRYRMLCPNCIHLKSGKRTVTFRSWDPQILAVLTPDLTAEFPALLSHRSGISKPLFSFLRSCFQTGMGSKQFSDALRVQHLLRHDEQHLQYLQHLAAQALDGYVGKKYDDFLPFDDTSNHGPHGYVPSSQWLRDMYDDHIEGHSFNFRQHMAMLSADICALDHSHKIMLMLLCDSCIAFSSLSCQITKHLARIDGEQIFTVLLSLTNELAKFGPAILLQQNLNLNLSSP